MVMKWGRVKLRKVIITDSAIQYLEMKPPFQPIASHLPHPHGN